MRFICLYNYIMKKLSVSVFIFLMQIEYFSFPENGAYPKGLENEIKFE